MTSIKSKINTIINKELDIILNNSENNTHSTQYSKSSSLQKKIEESNKNISNIRESIQNTKQ